MRVALVHDQLEQDGGAERVLRRLHRMFPQAPIFTAFWNRRVLPNPGDWDVRTSWMQRIPGVARRPRLFAALYPLAFASLQLRDFDLIISLTSGFAKGIRSKPDALHVCYCLSPSNFVWRSSAYCRRRSTRLATAPLRAWLKGWDIWGAARPQLYITLGQTVADRIRDHYHREPVVIPPPVEASWFAPHLSQDFYLVVSRLVDHKRLDLPLRAAAQLGAPLLIAGEGRAESGLRRQAGPNVQFKRRVSDMQLRALYQRAIAVIVPAEEDFGLVAVEAQAAGTPVIAFDAGGAKETVIDGVTGIRFAPQTVAALTDAMARVARTDFDRDAIQRHAAQFHEDRFERDFRRTLQDYQRHPLTLAITGLEPNA